MEPTIPNLPPRKRKSIPNLSVQIQSPNDQPLSGDDDDLSDLITDLYSTDEFRMYDFKVRRCTRARSHDWTDCPFAHPGEKARRRDPRNYSYSPTVCPDYKSSDGDCPRGDTCGFAHGVFECWLHPTRYRTTPCRDGKGCRRKVCFFAHTRKQLRVLGSTEVTSPSSMFLSPTSTLVGPAVSPSVVRGREKVFGEMVRRLERLEISPTVTGSRGGGGGGIVEPDLEWVDELLE